MRKFLFFLAAAIAAASLTAAPVDQATAYKKAKGFLTNKLYSGMMMAPDALNPVLLKAEFSSVKLNEPVFYIYNTSTTFLVVAGDDRAEEILVVGDHPLDLNRVPEGLKDKFNQYKEEIEYLQSHPGLKVQPIVSPENTPSLNATTIGPLLTSTWDQDAPYWNQCVFTYNGTSYQCYTGCPATSASQVLYYWKYPDFRVSAISSYTRRFDISSTQVVYNYTYPALPATTFDWDNMLDSYRIGYYNNTQANAVATLMRYVGQAEKIMYGTQAAGGSGLYTSDQQNYLNMFSLFGYEESTLRYVHKSSYSEANWAALIQAEMTARRPILYDGQPSSNSDGHIYNVDGYRSSDNKYHCNFGWGGSGDAWCAMNSFGYGGEYFSYGQGAFIGIQPSLSSAPVLKANPTSLTFTETYLGDTNSKTFVISGRNVSSRVNVSVSGDGFSVSPTSFSADEIASGEATVTVTYNSFEVGTHEGTVTLSTTGAENAVVPVTGTTLEKPVLKAQPASLKFTTAVGSTGTKTFRLSGTNLNGNVTLKVTGTGFAIDKTLIQQAAATSGATITVTFTPTEAGSYTGEIAINSVGAATLIVPLTGTATDSNPRIYANPTSMSFEAATGETARQTLTVTGSNLSSDLTLALDDPNGVYTLSRTTITPSQATSGASVTVKYTPLAYGEHDATITISGGGATPVTVNLNGVASISKYTPVMLPPVDAYVAMTQFRAEWTDETPIDNVESYTLEVIGAEPVEPEPVLLATLNGSAYTGSYTALNLSAPWGGTNVYGGNNAIYFRNNYNGTNSPGNITYTIPAGYTNATFTMKIKTTSTNYGAGNFAVATPQTAAVYYYLSAGASQYWVVTASSGEKITITTADANYSADIDQIEVYSGNATPAMLMATETGGANYRLIEGITPNKYYTVKDLTAGGTFTYRVKALYVDGTQSDWSNEQEVTLHENDHPYQLGDVNHDGNIDIDDVSLLISYVLGRDVTVCGVCADLTNDGNVDIEDVSRLINIALGKVTNNSFAPGSRLIINEPK